MPSLEKMWFGHWMTEMIAGLASPELVWSCCTDNRLLSIVQGRSRWSVTDGWACSGSPGANVDRKVFRACSLKKDWLLGMWPFGTQMATCGLYRACQKGPRCLQKGYHQARLQGQRTTSWAHCYWVVPNQMSSFPHCWPSSVVLQTTENLHFLQYPLIALYWESLTS